MSVRCLQLVLLMMAVSGINAAESVIVHPSTPITGMSETEFKYYFTGKKTAWPDGSRVIVVTVTEGASQEALMKQLGKNESQFITGWKKLVFTGKGSMPETVNSEAELVELIAKTPGAIGYVDAGKANAGVKAIPIH